MSISLFLVNLFSWISSLRNAHQIIWTRLSLDCFVFCMQNAIFRLNTEWSQFIFVVFADQQGDFTQLWFTFNATQKIQGRLREEDIPPPIPVIFCSDWLLVSPHFFRIRSFSVRGGGISIRCRRKLYSRHVSAGIVFQDHTIMMIIIASAYTLCFVPPPHTEIYTRHTVQRERVRSFISDMPAVVSRRTQKTNYN